MYDFANSAFSTSVMSVIFSVYFAQKVVPATFAIPGESLWGYMVSGVMAIVLFLSPALGALADHKEKKRAFLFWFTLVGSVCTMQLFNVHPGDVWTGFAFIFAALLCFEMTQVFYNAFLKEIAIDEQAGRVSGLGFALGYIGGGLCLALGLFFIAATNVSHSALSDPTLPVRLAVLAAGIWWLFFSIPTFLWVKDDQKNSGPPVHSWFRQLAVTVKDIMKNPPLARFTLAYLIYNDGIQTILIMAAIFGASELGMKQSQLALCYLLIQFVAFCGAMICGRLADAWSHKKVVVCTLVIYALVTMWGVVMKSPREFWIMGVIVGLVLGGSQAASRSLYSILIPKERAGEFFAVYAVVGKASSLIGPFLFAVVRQMFGLRAAVGSLLVFFIVGGALLLTVREERR